MNVVSSSPRSNDRMRPIKAASILCLLALLLCATPSATLADDASLGRWGESVRPIQDIQVEMVEEDVRVRVTPTDSHVTCRFVFRNTGPATEALMGFPEEAPDLSAGPDNNMSIHDFRTWVRGSEVPVKRERGLDFPEEESNGTGHIFLDHLRRFSFWWTWNVPMQAGETLEVRNSYRVRNTFTSIGWMSTGYILSTGAGWKGPIGKARVTFEFAGPKPYEVVRAFPASYRFEDDSIIWEWSDFEPAADIEVVVWPRPGFQEHQVAMTGQRGPSDGPAPQQDERSDLFRRILSAGTRWDNASALRLVRQFKSLPALPSDAIEAASVLEARLRFLTGDRSYGKTLWKERVDSGAAGAEEYYFLGSLYRESGDEDGLADLYRRLCEAAPPDTDPPSNTNPGMAALWTVRRWLASHLKNPPPGEFATRKNPPVIEKVTVDPHRPSEYVSATLRAVISDDDGDLAQVRRKVWVVENGSERTLIDTTDGVHTGGKQASPEADFVLPWPFATAFYRVIATDAAGHVADSGVIEWAIDSGTSWEYLNVPSSNGLIRFRYRSETGRRLAADTSACLVPVLENLGSKMGFRPTDPIVVSFCEAPVDDLEKAMIEANRRHPWYMLGTGQAPTSRHVAMDVLSLVMVQNACPGWYAKADPEPNWLVAGLFAFLESRRSAPEPLTAHSDGSRGAWMVEALYREGVDKFVEFARRVDVDSEDQGIAVALREVYSLDVEDMNRKWQSELKQAQNKYLIRNVLLMATLGLCTAGTVMGLSTRRRHPRQRL